MRSLSKEAALVHEALVARGLETPLRPPVQEMDNETRKRLISGHMTEIMELLNLDLSDDSLMETPHRARNQWFGTVTARDRDLVQQHVEILLADGTTRLKVAITAQSGERLGLDEGKEVLVLLKAPWVNITRDPAQALQADNQLQGVVSHIDRGDEQCEVLMALPDGQILCATLPLAQAVDLDEGAEVTAYFNADRAIIATLC
jgi:molybdopterin-binding protein